MAEGSAITVQWGKRRWQAVVVELLEEAADDEDEIESEQDEAESEQDEAECERDEAPSKKRKKKDTAEIESERDEAPSKRKVTTSKDTKKRKAKTTTQMLAVHKDQGTCTYV